MTIIVGLGNVGERYALTRHNLGSRAVSAWLGDAMWKDDTPHNVQVASFANGLAIFPLTYMNIVGPIIASFMRFKKNSPESLIIVHDDIELELGTIRWKEGGSAAGHNGVRSIIESLGTDKFQRLRLGIGRPSADTPVDRFVLQPFLDTEHEAVERLIEQANQHLTSFFENQSPK